MHNLKNIPVLSFHKISNEFEYGITTYSPEKFEKFLQYLKKEKFHSFLPIDKKIPENPILLTFDDAYESVFSHAFPLMKKYGFRGLVFVISDFIGKKNTWDANLGNKKFKHLSEEQITELIRNNWEIGSHTKTHQSLRFSRKTIEEIKDSKKDLEKKFNISVESFAYPFGYFNSKLEKIVKKTYKHSFSATPNFSESPKGRVSIYKQDNIKQIKNKINLSFFEFLKVKLINLGAFLTEIYQLLKKENI